MDWAARFIEKIHQPRSYRPIDAPAGAIRPMGRAMIRALSGWGKCSYVLDEVNQIVTFIWKEGK